MPKDPACCTQIGWSPDPMKITNIMTSMQEWTKQDLVKYNFESPYVQWSRVEKLRNLLKALDSRGLDGGGFRRLAVVTKNKFGVIAILNLLLLPIWRSISVQYGHWKLKKICPLVSTN